jgi:transcriptional regulator GlxA family with amidase domain
VSQRRSFYAGAIGSPTWAEKLKVGRARTLLSETALTVKEVAFRCGFDSEQYLGRLFRS